MTDSSSRKVSSGRWRADRYSIFSNGSSWLSNTKLLAMTMALITSSFACGAH